MRDNFQPHNKPGEMPDNHNTQLLLALSIISRHKQVKHATFKEENLDNISTSTLVENLMPGVDAPSERE